MPTVPYNKMYQRPQQIMRNLSERGHTVYYRDDLKGDYFIKINKSLYEVGTDYKIKAEKLKRPVILWCSSPEQVIRIKEMDYDYIVYDIVDDYSHEFKVWNVYVEDMLKAADIVFTASDRLYQKFFQRHGKVYLVKNGVDTDNFSLDKNKIPRDIPRRRRIVGYVGALATWVDWDLVRYISDSNYDFVFIGAKYGDVNVNLNNNIYFLGERKYEELPYYISNFNCCIIPFKVNEMTNSCNPIKLYEYMSLGKPVVSTAIEEAVKVKNNCYISRGNDDFIENIVKSIEEDNEDLVISRRNFALNNSWDKRVSFIIEKLKLNNIL
jgi:glycosyltransferase involved in cell wall biosynthesis